MSETRILDETQLEIAGGLIRQDRLVVFPTETVYGLGANALSDPASARIFAAKGRPQDNPLIVHIASMDQIGQVAAAVNDLASLLMAALMPGPLTVILPRASGLATCVTAGKDTVGLRIPGSILARRFLAAAGVPVAAPSANRSGRPSPTSFVMALAEMEGRVDAILRGPDATVGLESTILWPENNHTIHLLRPGGVGVEEIVHACRQAGLSDVRILFNGQEISGDWLAVHDDGQAGTKLPAAPGTRYRHYSPKARVLVFTDRAELARHLALATNQVVPGGVSLIAAELCPGVEPDLIRRSLISYRSKFDSLADYGRHLYRELVEADHRGSGLVLAWLPPSEGLGLALRDRVQRAAGKTGT